MNRREHAPDAIRLTQLPRKRQLKRQQYRADTKFIAGRYTADERATMFGDRRTMPTLPIRNQQSADPQSVRSLPLVHILIPAAGWQNISDGLDGIAIDLPPLHVKPTHGEYFPLNMQVKDPLWPQRNLLDFSFSVKPGEARTLWLDTRDRILPAGKGLYLTIAGAGSDFGPASLAGRARSSDLQAASRSN